jgi:hypothetical protein
MRTECIWIAELRQLGSLKDVTGAEYRLLRNEKAKSHFQSVFGIVPHIYVQHDC